MAWCLVNSQHAEAGKTKQMTVGVIKGCGKNALQHDSPERRGEEHMWDVERSDLNRVTRSRDRCNMFHVTSVYT